MAYQTIQQSEINTGSIFDQQLLQKIKDNFDAHESGLLGHSSTLESYGTALATHATNITAATNKALKQVPIGTVRSSTLTLSQFSAEVDGTWQLMNGGSCVGTAYHTLTGRTTVPDALTEGTFLRQAKAGRTIGTYEADELKSHTHTITVGGDGGTNNHPEGTSQSTLATRSGWIGNTGGDETRPKNTAVNFFIKVGY